jgi:hypothetical protein
MEFMSLPINCKNCNCSPDGVRCSYFGRDVKSQEEALTCSEYEAVIQDKANRIMPEFHGVSFNGLAWDAPKLEDGNYGYLPSHEKYDIIVAWLNSRLEVRWVVDGEENISKRLSGVYNTGHYDVEATCNKKSKAVSWRFIKDYVYETAGGFED